MTHPHKLTLALAVTVAALALGGCGAGSPAPASSSSASSSASASHAPAATRVAITISGYAFHPPTVTVAPGTMLAFSNRDATAHTATSSTPGFDTGTIAPGRTATVVVRTPGTYTYICQFHAFMQARVVVR